MAHGDKVKPESESEQTSGFVDVHSPPANPGCKPDVSIIEIGQTMTNDRRQRGESHEGVPEDCLAGGGELGALMRSMDWATTPLGPVASWPQSLRTSVSIMLSSGFAVVVAWGSNGSGGLGINSRFDDHSQPVQVTAPGGTGLLRSCPLPRGI